jgi:soluble lytic murein transglycosylase
MSPGRKPARQNKAVLVILVFLFLLLLAEGLLPRFRKLAYPLPYYEYIADSAARHQVDPFLVAAVIKVESRFDPEALSHRGARGLMQIMPSTGVWAAGMMGMRDFSEDMLFDPMHNIEIGTWYLASLKKEFNGRLPVVIAAYNGGRGKVSSWLGSGIWDGTYEGRRNIPYAETRTFLQKVLDNYEGYRSLYLRS